MLHRSADAERYCSENIGFEGRGFRSASHPASSSRQAALRSTASEAGSDRQHSQWASDLHDELQSEIDALAGRELGKIESAIRDVCRSRFPEIQQLCDHVGGLAGKRLRPILAIVSSQISSELLPANRRAGGLPDRDLVYVAAAVELVHAASLVHDDVMDRATTRRHKPTVGSLVGTHSAILLGDFLFTKAYEMAARCSSRYPARRLAKAASALCEGELRQQLTAGNWSLGSEVYRGILAQKTGALCAASCRLGAWSAGEEISIARCLGRYGARLGLAFQVFDDWLDYWGTQRVGKTLGTDLEQRKPTLPLLRLLETASPADRKELVRLLQSEPGDAETDSSLRAMLEDSDACEFTLSTARSLAVQAVEELQPIADCRSKDFLSMLAAFSVSRND